MLASLDVVLTPAVFIETAATQSTVVTTRAIGLSDVAAVRAELGPMNGLQDRGQAYLDLIHLYQAAGADSSAIGQLLEQAQITTGSGPIGGAALLLNDYVRGVAGTNADGTPKYDVSLDGFSWQIANRLLDAIQWDIEQGGSGVLSRAEIRALDLSVWNEKGLAELFPGNAEIVTSRDTIPSDSVVYQFISASDLKAISLTNIDIDWQLAAMAPLVANQAVGMGTTLEDLGFSRDSLPQDGTTVYSADGKYSVTLDSIAGSYNVTNLQYGVNAGVFPVRPVTTVQGLSAAYHVALSLMPTVDFAANILGLQTRDVPAVDVSTGTPYMLSITPDTIITPSMHDDIIAADGFGANGLGVFRTGIPLLAPPSANDLAVLNYLQTGGVISDAQIDPNGNEVCVEVMPDGSSITASVGEAASGASGGPELRVEVSDSATNVTTTRLFSQFSDDLTAIGQPISETQTYDSPNASVTLTYGSFDSDNQPVGAPDVEVESGGKTFSGAELAQGFVSGLTASLLQGQSPFIQVGLPSFASGVIAAMAGALRDGQQQSVISTVADGSSSELASATSSALGSLVDATIAELPSQAMSVFGDMAYADLAQNLGIPGSLAPVGNAALGSIEQQIGKALVHDLSGGGIVDPTSMISDLSGDQVVTSIENAEISWLSNKLDGNTNPIASFVGGFAGTQAAPFLNGLSLGSGVADGSGLASIASVVGDVASFAGNIIPIFGQIAVDVVMTELVDHVFLGLFGVKSNPWVLQYLTFDPTSNSIQLGTLATKHSVASMRDGVSAIATSITAAANSVISDIGGTVDPSSLQDPASMPIVEYSKYVNDFAIQFGSSGAITSASGDPSKLVTMGASQLLRNVAFLNGDPIKLELFERWQASDADQGERISASAI